MISERKFAAAYTSVWNEILPRVDGYSRRLNWSCERYEEEIPMLASSHRDRRGIVNELGFRLLRRRNATKENLSDHHVRDIAESVRRYIEVLSRSDDSIVKEQVADVEIEEAKAISASLISYFSDTTGRESAFWPWSFQDVAYLTQSRPTLSTTKHYTK